MTQSLFDIIFRGDILPGQQIAAVKSRLAKLFNTDASTIDALFTGGAVPLKRNLDRAGAEQYLAVLRRAGADVQAVAAGSIKAAPRRNRGSAADSGSAAPAGGQPRQTLRQRLAAEAAAGPAVSPDRSPDASLSSDSGQQAAVNQPAPEALPRAVAGSETESADLSLRPVGSDMLDAAERQPPQPLVVDTSGLSLRAAEGNLVDSDELSRPQPVVVGDINFSLDEPGADLLRQSERRPPAAVSVQLPELEVAPAGSDLGQKKAPPPPPPPDTSAIALVSIDQAVADGSGES
ncbi:hypothetical protein G8764_07055 [Pseudomaricurvus alcaniphilus]|uniref:hypothetical protein n=1 Tax=Pseudomaricurvus alcaniphilus TaxID=1166482 RepID=UPI00140C4F82|nr:hypothetical protein [Pseudomaricurvus alcaniphilus]NHN37044.1 hypothetical protein [Pseudomaricurvus alcaniphilus]